MPSGAVRTTTINAMARPPVCSAQYYGRPDDRTLHAAAPASVHPLPQCPAGQPCRRAKRQIHAIVDNYATHKHAKVKAWLARHPPSRSFHFTLIGLLAECGRRVFAKLTGGASNEGCFARLSNFELTSTASWPRPTPIHGVPMDEKDPGKIIAAVKGHQALDSIPLATTSPREIEQDTHPLATRADHPPKQGEADHPQAGRKSVFSIGERQPPGAGDPDGGWLLCDQRAHRRRDHSAWDDDFLARLNAR